MAIDDEQSIVYEININGNVQLKTSSQVVIVLQLFFAQQQKDTFKLLVLQVTSDGATVL